MKKVRYKVLPATGPGSVPAEETLDEFLLSMPHLFYFGYVPPLDIVNLFLSSGIDEAGMSGGCEWEPFEISRNEYEELLKTLEKRTYVNGKKLDTTLANSPVESKNAWYAKVMEEEFGIPFNKHLELMDLEDSLRIKAEKAFAEGKEELGHQLHMEWYEAANRLNEFCDQYMNAPNDDG